MLGGRRLQAEALADPSATLKAEGVEVPANLTIRVPENDDKLFHLVIPVKPADRELSDEDLSKVAGGMQIHGSTKNYNVEKKPLEVEIATTSS